MSYATLSGFGVGKNGGKNSEKGKSICWHVTSRGPVSLDIIIIALGSNYCCPTSSPARSFVPECMGTVPTALNEKKVIIKMNAWEVLPFWIKESGKE